MHWVKAWYARTWAVLMVSLATVPLAHGQDADDLAWYAAQREGTYEGYQRYLEEFPVGRHSGEAFRLMIEQSIQSEQGTSPDIDVTPIY